MLLRVIVALVLIWSAVAPSHVGATRPMMATGSAHSLLVTEAGNVFAIGSYGNGQLGNGTLIDSPTAWVPVTSLTNVIQVAVGGSTSLALKRDGTVWSWGAYSAIVPAQVTAPGFVDIVSIVAAGGGSYYALHRDGHVWSWGLNSSGQLGDGTTDNRFFPAQIAGLEGVSSISASGTHAVALHADGTLTAWGANAFGQLGDGTRTAQSTPVAATTLTNVVRVAAGVTTTYAVLADGTARAWGSNERGQLGDNSFADYSLTPVTVRDVYCGTEIGAGFDSAVVITCSGAVLAWGANESGQLGLGDTTDRRYPNLVKLPYGYLSVPAGATGLASSGPCRRNFAYLQAGGTVYGQFYGWGDNSGGALGTFDTANRTSPNVVLFLSPGAKAGKRTNFSNVAHDSDVLWRNSSGANVIWSYHDWGPTDFIPYVVPSVDATWVAAGTGDVTGDAISDVVWFQASTGQVAIWIMATPGRLDSVTFPANVGAGSGWSIQAIGDLDGDSRGDILWRNVMTGEVTVWFMNSSGMIDQAVSYGHVPLSYEIKALADIDGDWLKDIVWFEPATGQVVIWNMHPNGSYTAWFPASVGAGSGWNIEGVGQFDLRGREEVFWRNANGQTALWRLLGPLVVEAKFLLSAPVSEWSVQSIGDYDGDGMEDILWLSNAGQVARWKMRGHDMPIFQGVTGIGPGWQSVQ